MPPDLQDYLALAAVPLWRWVAYLVVVFAVGLWLGARDGKAARPK